MDHEEKYNTARWDAGQVRREGGERPTHSAQSAASEERRRRNRRKGRERRFLLWLIFVVAVSAILAGVGWLLANDMCAFNKEPVTATIEVTKDDDVNSIATKLKNEGLIEYKWFFKLFGAVRHAGDKIGIGTYELNTDMDYNALINAMSARSGSRSQTTVTIPEGYTIDQIFALLEEEGVSTVATLQKVAANYDFKFSFLKGVLPLGDYHRLEGYLFPDTYEFYMGGGESAAVQVLNKMILRFDQMFPDALRQQCADMGYSIHQMVTIASLIEKETDGKDQTHIASVIYNRLEKPNSETVGLLQIDATLVYALGRQISQADYTADTPYNTYTNQGLPPGPIASPGMVALNSALNPASTNDYYYVLGNDGAHHFFRTHQGQLDFIAQQAAAAKN